MVFDDIVGQYNVIKNLKNSIANGRVAHAYMFCGPDGVGKSVAASLLAMSVNCRRGGIDPCGVCPSCIRARDGNHPDIINVKTSKAIIHVDEIRELQEDMQKKPYEKGAKVYIIHESEKMNDEAQNCLLKTLEEPPQHVMIILLCQSQYSMLKTIVSRCQVLKFTRAPERDIEEYLKRKGTSEEDARFAAAFSDGIVQRAEDFLSREDLKKSRDEILDMAVSLHGSDKLKTLSYVDYFLNNKDSIDYILNIMMSFFRDILIYKECGEDRYLLNLDKKKMIAGLSDKFTYSNLNNIIECIKNTMSNIKSNVNYQLSIEMMLLKVEEG